MSGRGISGDQMLERARRFVYRVLSDGAEPGEVERIAKQIAKNFRFLSDVPGVARPKHTDG